MRKVIALICFSCTVFSESIDVHKVSEAMGHIIGKNLQSLGLDIDLDAVVKGLKEETEGKDSPLNEDECIQAIATLQDEKIEITITQELQKIDAISNGDQIPEHENHPLPATDSTKYR